jgi:zinc protease
VIALARKALTEPRFDEAALERVRAQTIASLERDARNPNTIAARSFNALAFEGHPYARPTDGTPESVAALTRDDIVAAHEAALTRDRVLVGAAGDISAEELAHFSTICSAICPRRRWICPITPSSPRRAGSPSSTIPGRNRSSPSAMRASRATTRLHGRLRDERNLRRRPVRHAADARVARDPRPDLRRRHLGRGRPARRQLPGPAFDRQCARGPGGGAFAREWEWLAEGGITQADLERVQTYLTGAYPLRFDGNASIAGILASMQFQGFDIDYVNVRNDLVRAVTLEDIERVADRMIDPEALHFVIVGQPQGLEELSF